MVQFKEHKRAVLIAVNVGRGGRTFYKGIIAEAGLNQAGSMRSLGESSPKMPPRSGLVRRSLIYGNMHYRKFLYKALKCRQFRTFDRLTSPTS